MLPSSDVPAYAHTIAGALLPVVVLFVGGFLTLLLKRLERKWEVGHQETQDGQRTVVTKLERKLAEAEGALRGDLQNGVKHKLDSIEEKVDTVNQRQGQSTKENSGGTNA